MATRASQQPIAGPTLTAIPQEVSRKMRLAYNNRLELSLHRILTLMATRASQQLIACPILIATLGESPERCRVADNDSSEQPTLGLHPNGYPS